MTSFIVDQQLPKALATLLTEHGHDARHIKDYVGGTTMPDADTARLADSQGRLVTPSTCSAIDTNVLADGFQRLRQMVPELLAGPGGPNSRGARVPPHDRKAMRRARGLEAAVLDNSVEEVRALDPADERTFYVRVAGPAALLGRQNPQVVGAHRDSAPDHVSAETTSEALDNMRELVAAGSDAVISMMAGRAELGLGEPETVSAATAILARDLLQALAIS